MEWSLSENGGSILKHHLSRLGLLGAMAHDLIQNHAPIEYPRRSIIFLQNSPADLLFWVKTGLVKICSPASDGSRFVVHLAGPGEVIGDVSVDDSDSQKVQAFEAESFTRCSIAPITREHVRRVLSKLGSAEMVRVMEEANSAWARIFADFVRFLSLNYRERLESVIKDLASRFGVRDARGILLAPELSHEEFAELIGSSRPMASRLLSELTDEGIIERDGRRYVLREVRRGAVAQGL